MLNLVDPAQPRPFRRRARGTFAAALWSLPTPPADALRETYPMLVRALANISLCYVPGHGVLFTTMERGCYLVPEGPDLAETVVARLEPLATAHLVIDNEFRRDLEPELWGGDDLTREIGRIGRRLDRLGLLPAPFPVEDLVSERDLRQIKRLYSIGGLSYGNLSAREDGTRFWMSASGVDKSKLDEPGRDILLVSGYDAAHGKIVLSVPPDVEPRRVSVDAIEHWMIYRANPEVGAHPPHPRLGGGHRRHRDQLSLRHRRAGRERRRAGGRRAGSGAHGRRPAQPRDHGDRREPDGDPRPDRAGSAPAGTDGLNLGEL